MGWLKNQKLKYLENRAELVPQLTHFEKLLVCRGGTFNSLTTVLINIVPYGTMRFFVVLEI